MWHAAVWYFGVEVAVILAAVIYTTLRRRRRLRHTEPIPPGFVRTDETFVDPTTGIQQAVWYNPETGERRYVASERERLG